MPNVLNDLASDIYKAADIVGREAVGMIPSIMVNTGIEQVAIGQTVRSFTTPKAELVTTTPSMTIPEGTDQEIGNKTLELTSQKGVPIPWTGEDIKYVNGGTNASHGAGFQTIYGDQIAQAMRVIANTIEAELLLKAKQSAGNAIGTSGTNPFASNFDIIADIRQLHQDRGAPVDDGQSTMVMDTLAGAALRKQAQLQKVNESADGGQFLRRGALLDLQGFMLKESAGVRSHTKGTGASYDVDLGAGYDADDTTIHVDTGTGTLVQGDVVNFSAGNDGKKVVVGTGFAGDGDGDIILNSGLMNSVADGADLTIENNYSANIALHRASMELAMRAPAKPMGGDAAVDVMIVRDPFSGLVFEISVYKGFNKAMIYVGAVWGHAAWKSDFITIVQG